jgi:hypothetical protein
MKAESSVAMWVYEMAVLSADWSVKMTDCKKGYRMVVQKV